MPAERMLKHGRATVLWALLCYLGGQAALTWSIERTHPEWADPEYGYRVRNLVRRMKAEPGRPLLLVLGSSLVCNGFAADRLPPASARGGEPATGCSSAGIHAAEAARAARAAGAAEAAGAATCKGAVTEQLLQVGLHVGVVARLDFDLEHMHDVCRLE